MCSFSSTFTFKRIHFKVINSGKGGITIEKTLEEFQKLYENKPGRKYSSEDPKPQSSCLIKFYMNEVLGISEKEIKKISWNTKDFYDNASKHTVLKKNFHRIPYNSSNRFIPQKGDIVIWDSGITSVHDHGHIAIALGTGNAATFETLDQDWNGSDCVKVTHSYKALLGILRPKDQIKISLSGSYPHSVVWSNNSKPETVFAVDNLKTKLGMISAEKTAKCYRVSGKGYLVVYKLDGTKKHKAGFVKHDGGVIYQPTSSKTYKSISSPQMVYADTNKSTIVGCLNLNETCHCLAKIDGMYLVHYNVTGTSTFKCGFVTHNGGC